VELHTYICNYGVATISRLLQITGSFAKEPYKTDDILQKRPIIFKAPTHRSHPIDICCLMECTQLHM